MQFSNGKMKIKEIGVSEVENSRRQSLFTVARPQITMFKLALLLFLAVVAAAHVEKHDYCVVGAGPGGLQVRCIPVFYRFH